MISLIVPVYNTEKYIRECVESIINQTYKNWEVIIIDDGSTDYSPSICDEFTRIDSRIKVIHQANGGLSAARNAGLNLSQGEYIMFVDSDDVLPSDALEVLRNTLIVSKSDIICGDFITFKSYSELESIHLKSNDKFKVFISKDAIRDVLYQRVLNNSAWGKIYRRYLWDDVRFTQGIGYEDLDIFYRIFIKANKIGYINKIVYFYRKNMESILNTFSNLRLDVLMVTQRMEEYFAENYPDLLPAASSRKLSANFNILGILPKYKFSDVEEDCWCKIIEMRRKVLFDKCSPIKNKIFIILSYILPRMQTTYLLRLFYKIKKKYKFIF